MGPLGDRLEVKFRIELKDLYKAILGMNGR